MTIAFRSYCLYDSLIFFAFCFVKTDCDLESLESINVIAQGRKALFTCLLRWTTSKSFYNFLSLLLSQGVRSILHSFKGYSVTDFIFCNIKQDHPYWFSYHKENLVFTLLLHDSNMKYLMKSIHSLLLWVCFIFQYEVWVSE